MEAIEAIDWVEEIVVPVAEEKIAELEALLPAWRLHKTVFVAGGEARHRSIFAGNDLCCMKYISIILLKRVLWQGS